MTAFAKGTEVPIARTQEAIRSLLQTAGAGAFAVAEDWSTGRVGFSFEASNRRVRMIAQLPTLAQSQTDGRGRRLTVDQAKARREAEGRRLWRALLLILRARLEAVESGIQTFEQAFLSDIVLPDGRTVHESTRGAIAESYASGRVSGPLLALPSSTSSSSPRTIDTTSSAKP